MDLSKMYNPYDFANPVSNVSLLVGREKEMDEIKYYLDNAKAAPRPINIALLGQRASGKTSILNITQFEAKRRGFCTVRINLDEDDITTQMAFFHKLFDSIITEACQIGAFGGIDGKTYETYLDAVNAYTIPEDKIFCPFFFPIQYAKSRSSNNLNVQVSDISFQSDLTKVHEEIKVPIVLLFDEGNILAQSRVLLQKLRNVFMNTPGYMLVMTGTPDLFPVMDDVFSPIVRQFKKIIVGEFRNIESTRDCIRRPLEKLGIEIDKVFDFETYQDVFDIHNLSGGRPYEIQLICHMLFRRVQFKRAEIMKLDFSVLEEVRGELENQQDITSRPILTRVRHFRDEQLVSLSLLCSCDGQLTFDQLWELEYIFNGESSWTKDALGNALKTYEDQGILKVDNEIISFAGDDFDKIYTKYFAKEQDITLNFTSFPLELKWENELNAFINKYLKDRLVRLYLSHHMIHTAYTTQTILDVIHKMASQNFQGDVFVDSSPLSEELYKTMAEHQDQMEIPLIEINPNLPWLNRQVSYTTVDPSDSQALEECINHVCLLSERIAKVGGNLAIERRDLPIVPLKTLVNKVEYTANIQARHSLAGFHVSKMRSIYLGNLKREEALFHADLSLRYNSEPSIIYSNDIGYVLLAFDDYDRAEALFKRAITLSQSSSSKEELDDEEDLDAIWPLLPIYNLGVLRAERGQLEMALADFQSCINLAQDLSSDERSFACLWVPKVNNEVLIFEERMNPDIFEVAVEAKAATEYVLTNKGDRLH